MNLKDELFRNNDLNGKFRFNSRVAEVFDDMLVRSVPLYSHVISMSAQILKAFLQDHDTVYDLGCSTGTTLLELSRSLAGLHINYIGIDNSSAMLEKARLKVDLYNKSNFIHFIEQDITQVDIEPSGAIILNYTLQFIAVEQRLEFLKKIFNSLRKGGVLILSEKIVTPGQRINSCFMESYHDFKRSQGYSEIEITRKREALEDVLIPLAADENRRLLEQAGFAEIETFCRWFNFASFVALKA